MTDSELTVALLDLKDATGAYLEAQRKALPALEQLVAGQANRYPAYRELLEDVRQAGNADWAGTPASVAHIIDQLVTRA